MNSMTIVTYSLGFIVHDEITHMLDDYLYDIIISHHNLYLGLHGCVLGCVHLCTCMYVCGCLNIVFQVFRCNYLYMKRLDCF